MEHEVIRFAGGTDPKSCFWIVGPVRGQHALVPANKVPRQAETVIEPGGTYDSVELRFFPIRNSNAVLRDLLHGSDLGRQLR